MLDRSQSSNAKETMSATAPDASPNASPNALPWTPDFDHHPVTHRLVGAAAEGDHVRLIWDDGRESRHHAFQLRENSPDPDTIHPLSREMLISPLDLPADLRAVSASVDAAGALVVVWSDAAARVSRHHPGWLRRCAWFADTDPEPDPRVLWTAEEAPEPPTFDGPAALAEPRVRLAWLEALQAYGVARLEGLAQRDGLLEEVVAAIGPIRESNFGRRFTLEIKDDPDSNAFTPLPLLLHTDMPTRECPHGLQFLYCRENTARGGEGVYVDGARIAEDLRVEEPKTFAALTEVVWEFNNRSKSSAYRARAAAVTLDERGRVSEVRVNAWLRAPLKAPLEEQARGYRAIRAFTERAEDPRYQMVFAYRPGDLLAFDNRRALHGRRGYDAEGGQRFIEGVYADRDDLLSRIRTLRRQVAMAGPMARPRAADGAP